MDSKKMRKTNGGKLALVASLGFALWTPLSACRADDPNAAGPEATSPKIDAESARALVKEARECLIAGDLERAENLAKRAATADGVNFRYLGDSPDKILSAVAAKRETVNQQLAVERLAQARRALDQNRLDEAERFIAQAEELNPRFTILYRGDRPEKLRGELARRRSGAARNPESETEVRTAVYEADDHAEQGRTPVVQAQAKARPISAPTPVTYEENSFRPEEATDVGVSRPVLQAAAEAQAEVTVGGSVSKHENAVPELAAPAENTSRRPSKLPSRRTSPAAESVPIVQQGAASGAEDPRQLLAKARGHLITGNHQEALRLATQVQRLGVTFGKNEDSPDAIIEAVQTMQVETLARENPRALQAAAQKAASQMAEARELQKEGRLLEALQLAQEAQKWSAALSPGEGRPESLIAELRKASHSQMTAMLADAQKHEANGNFSDCEKYLRYAEQVGLAFQHDTQIVKQRLADLEESKRSAEAVKTVAAVPEAIAVPQGGERVEAMPAEIGAGQSSQSTAIPVVAMPQLQPQGTPSGSADAQQARRQAEAAYDMAMRAVEQKQYAAAADHLRAIDLRLLDATRQASAQTVLSYAQQNGSPAVAQVQHDTSAEPGNAPGKATATDQAMPPQAQPSQPGLIGEVQARRALLVQKAKEQKLESERESMRLIQRGDHDAAIAVLEQALESLKTSGLEEPEMAPLRRQLDDRLANFRKVRNNLAADQARRKEQKEKMETPIRKFREKEERDRQVVELMKEHKQFMDAGRYKEAELKAVKAQLLEPNDAQIVLAIEKARLRRQYEMSAKNRTANQEGVATALNDADASAGVAVSDKHPVSYSPEFADMSKRRTTKAHNSRPFNKPKSPADREVETKLNSTKVNVDFRNKPLSEVLDELHGQTGINIITDKPRLEAEYVELEQPITMQLRDVPLSTALRHILQNARLTYVVREGIVKVTTSAGEKGDLVTVTYPVADLIIPVENYGNIATPAKVSAGQGAQESADGSGGSRHMSWSLAGGTPVGTPAPASPSAMAVNQWTKAPRLPGQTMEETLKQLITETIDPLTWDSKGGSGKIDFFPLTMGLVVTQTPDIQEQIQVLLDRLRELQDLQVTVEVRFITLSENFFERIGIDLDFNINDKEDGLSQMVANNAFAPAGFLNDPDYLKNVLVGMNRDGTLTQNLDIPISQTSFDRTSPPFGGFDPGTPGGISFGLAFLSDIEVFLFLEAAQANNRSNIMQAPKITLFNGQTATLNVSQDQLLVVGFDVQPNVFGDATLVPRQDPFTSATNLQIQAVISADRRYVRLTLTPQLTNVEAVNTVTVQTPAGPQALQQPTTSRIFVSTTVSVPDGGTILMGGLKRISEGRNEAGVPILNKIPYVNRFFKNTGYGRTTTTLMIMVTPRIIIPEEEEERLGTIG